MDLYLTLSVGIWAVGGLFSSAWLFWLDRDRRELGFPLKAATLVFWPITFPVLLHERGDLTGWEAGRNALVWLSIVAPGLVMNLNERMRPSPTLESHSTRTFVITPPPAAPPTYQASPLPLPLVAISENDKREAVRYWNSGIIYYQKGDYEKSREEWDRCRTLDPSNSDCTIGLNRIEQSFGLASAVR